MTTTPQQFPKDAVEHLPIGGSTDDWAHKVPAIEADPTRAHVLLPGAYIANSKQEWPSSSRTVLSQGVSITYDQRPVGSASEDGSPIYHDIVPATTTTVGVLGVVGSTSLTLVSDAAVSEGDRILVFDAAKCVRGYEIVEKLGDNIVSLDAPLSYPFPIGALVKVIPLASQCRDVRIEGNGAQFVAPLPGTQTADKLIELYGAWDCCISDLVLDAAGARLMGCSYDMGGVRNTWERIVEDGGGVAVQGIALEGNRASKILHCSTRANTFAGVDLGSCTGCLVDNLHSDSDYDGVMLCALNGDTVGCTGCASPRR